MSEVNTDSGKKQKKGAPKKLNLRVDFTPMVDMNMLLITFFMFCTTLSKPQMMNLVMPTKDNKDIVDAPKNLVDEAKTITLLLAGDDVVYYYLGKPDYTNYESLIATNYNPEGLRSILTKRNGDVIRQIAELRTQKQLNKISEEDFKAKTKEIRDAKGGQVVVIKPTPSSTYKNLVDVLDEMQICSIGKYAIVDLTEGDKFLIDNYLQKGALSAQALSVN